MTQPLGTLERPLRIAIIGAGPSGFYAAGALLQQNDIVIALDLFDRLPTPYGLVRYGVAPDHQKIKAVTKLYERIAAHPRFRFFGNIQLGRDLTLADLHCHYDQILFAVGTEADRHLNIPGESLCGSLSATEFVAWYNGHPDFVDLKVDLNSETAVVVGVGNVAMDVTRILAKSVDELKGTDIADYALDQLATSQVRDIYVLARRGPAQVKFTPAEIKELGELAEADIVVDPSELALDSVSAAEIAHNSEARKNIEHLQTYAARSLTGKPRRIHFRFLVSPVEILGTDGRVTAVRIEKNHLLADDAGTLNAQGTGQFETLSAGLLLRSVGYKGTPLTDVPYEPRTGTIPNEQGRVKNPATETVKLMLADVPVLTPAPEPDPAAIDRLLAARKLSFVTIEDWRMIDKIEVAKGVAQGKPRVKFTRVREILDVLRK